jgi:hypothetical protein
MWMADGRKKDIGGYRWRVIVEDGARFDELDE